MNTPSSRDILATLIELLADQENVKITYELEDKEDVRYLFASTVPSQMS